MKGEGENGQRMDDYTDDWMDRWEEGRAGTWTSGGGGGTQANTPSKMLSRHTETQKKRRRHKSMTKRSTSRLKYQHNSLS